MLQHKRSQGGALLTALFIMTLVAIVATAMSTRLQLDIYRTRLIVTHDKLYMATQAVTFWSMDELNNKSNKFTKSDKQGMVIQFPKRMETLIPQVKLRGALYDLQARFNLNNLSDKKFIPVFVNLLSHVVELGNAERVNLALALQNWLMDYDLARGKDIYTSYYLSQQPPYYPGHQKMNSVSELRLIKDVSGAIYKSIEPFITVLPEPTSININTASKEALMSLGNGLTETQVNELIMARGNEGIKDLKKINELSQKINLPSDQITIESQYFLNIASAASDEFNTTVYTILKRTIDKKGKVSVGIIQQSVGTF